MNVSVLGAIYDATVDAVYGLSAHHTEMETTSLDAADGNIGDTARAGLILRWLGTNMYSAGVTIGSIVTYLYNAAHTIPTVIDKIGDNARSLYAMLGTRWDSSGDLGTDIAAILTDVDKTVAGRTQVFSKAITSAANAGDVVLATATTQAVRVHGLTLRSNGATTADFTTIGIYGATGKRATLLTTTQGTLANLAADGNQQTSDFGQGGVQLNVGETIVATLTGGGATAVAFTAYFSVSAIVDGGYLA